MEGRYFHRIHAFVLELGKFNERVNKIRRLSC